MRLRLAAGLGLLLASMCWPAPAAAQEVSLAGQVVERVLPNGLKVLMVKRTEAPLIRCILAYRVGAVNERPGITGISHFHEHMMFKGTRSMGIKPGTFARDEEYNRQIDALMDQVAAEEARPGARDEAKIAGLKQQASALLERQKKETIVSEEIWSAYQAAGGTGINASTGSEMTQYYVTLPKNALELYLALEADRMVHPVFREFYSERDVVAEERRMSENSPGFFFQEQLNATFYAAHPYANPVVGWMSDISRVTKQEMIAYREIYYRPDNATLVLAGDLDPEQTMALVEKYFGGIASRGPSPRVRTEEPSPFYYRRTIGGSFKPPFIEKRVIGRAATNPQVVLMFHIPPLWHDDLPALYMLGRVLGARTGRMYLDLVQAKEHAASVMASASDSMYDGVFRVSATGREVQGELAAPLDQIEKGLWSFIEDAKSVPVDPQLLERTKNSVEAQYLQGLAGTGIAGTLARMETAYRWQYIDEQYRRRMAVTPDDLMRVAKAYLTRDNCVTGILEREQ
ncbi:MAG TPA: pitrilysin family protein [Vicinamibacterales bacterium]|nr:pitrilysin family protein [Vicinamibacterales bacterium]HPW20820.1 pitrilysin family protein [Vicinamibacterales bacterium]